MVGCVVPVVLLGVGLFVGWEKIVVRVIQLVEVVIVIVVVVVATVITDDNEDDKGGGGG
jgi:hypothetical protein